MTEATWIPEPVSLNNCEGILGFFQPAAYLSQLNGTQLVHHTDDPANQRLVVLRPNGLFVADPLPPSWRSSGR